MLGFGNELRGLVKKVKVSKAQINRIVKKHRDTGVLGRKEGTGRKRKTTPLQDRLILRQVKKDRKSTGEEIRHSLQLQHISDRTGRNRIRESGEFKSYWSTRKPFINKKNRKRRWPGAKQTKT